MNKFAFGNPTDYYIEKSYFYKNIFGKPTVTWAVCWQDTLEEAMSFDTLKEACKFITQTHT